MKQCIICKEIKPYSEYYKHPATRDGYLTKCKDCQKTNAKSNQSPEKERARYKRNPVRRLQVIYLGMLRRCNDPLNKRYHCYGALGVKVLRSTSQEFIDDMLDSYLEHYELNKNGGTKRMTQIDRIDVTGNYCKENCRWATPKQQAENKRKIQSLAL